MKHNLLRYSLLLLICGFSSWNSTPLFAIGKPPVILVLGDSLSAGYGIKQGNAWPDLLQIHLDKEKKRYHVINLSISGETTGGGLSRLSNALKKYKPSIVVLALGANDALRGLPLQDIRDNLQKMIRLACENEAKVLLITLRIPLNYGAYADDFYAIYPALAREENLPSPPFLLERIATNPKYFQADTIHPTLEAQPIILETIWPSLSLLLQ